MLGNPRLFELRRQVMCRGGRALNRHARPPRIDDARAVHQNRPRQVAVRAQCCCVSRVSIGSNSYGRHEGSPRGVPVVDASPPRRHPTSWEGRAAPDATGVTGEARGPRPLGVDCRLLAVVADFDAPRLGLFGHRNGQPQHSVVVAGLDFVGVEVFPEE